MKLKKFSIQGFKSFADKTSIDFDGGIIAVVGPNGCGKSNIADAIRWVTGEKSAKSLRSPSMTDVIFSGTEKRRALGFAEVTLTLTDVGDALPTDYDSIAITRRLHRSGESQYFINKNQVRLKDIEQLLSGTGIGKNSISIFEQGKIDQIIYLSPEERRVIIEEVAGVSRFIKQKKDALRNMRKTDENLSRVADILTEVEKQKKNAERQAEKAAEYKVKSERLETLDIAVIVTRWQGLDGKSEKENEQFKTLGQALEEISEGLHEKEVLLHETKGTLEERRQILKSKSEAHFGAKNRREVKLETGRMTSEKLQESAEKEQELIIEAAELEKTIKETESEREQKLKEQESADAELEVKTNAIHDEREKVELLEAEVATITENFQQKQREHLQLAQEGSQSESEWREANMRLEHLASQSEESKLKISTLDHECKTLKEQIEQKKEELSQLQELVEGDKERQEEVLLQLAEIESEKEVCVTSQEKEKRTLSEKQARLQALTRLKEEMEGFSKGTKALMQESSLTLKNLYELLEIPKDLPQSATQALKAYYQTLVVETEKELYALLEKAKEMGCRDFSVLCLEHLGVVDDLAKTLLSHIQIVEDPKEAFSKRSEKSVFVTKEGSYIDFSGVLFCPGKEENNVFAREAEINELQEQIHEGAERLSELQGALDAQLERKAHLEQIKSELDHKLRQDEMHQVERNYAVQNLEQNLGKLSAEKQQLAESSETSSEKIKELKERIVTLAEIYEQSKSKAQEVTDNHQELEEGLSQKQSTYRMQIEKLREMESEYKVITSRSQQVAYDIGILEMRIKQTKEQSEKVQKGIDHAKAAQEILTGQDTLSSEELEELDSQVEKFARAVAIEEETIRSMIQRVTELETLVGNERVKERELIEKKGRLEVALSQHISLKEALEKDLEERHNMHPKEAKIEPVENLKEAELELKSLRRSLETMGPVNMAAIEEREEYQERYDYLSKQVEDLEGSKLELMQIIEELETESRKLFEETFEQVRVNFRKNFEILFNGGEADLKLVGSEEILDAGVEVSCRPPGKQMRSISLLSGGEKCMTALALLFAIFEVKPAPFCVLDEIDAPLDDTNVGRFVEVLKQFTADCQFIIITHNKRTMSIADTLFGVSMPEKGVSKMLSMEFRDEKKMIEPVLV